jgi:hypothetical protein
VPEDDAMGSDTKTGLRGEECGPDSIEQTMRERIRETIEVLVDAELKLALGVARSTERVVRINGRIVITPKYRTPARALPLTPRCAEQWLDFPIRGG